MTAEPCSDSIAYPADAGSYGCWLGRHSPTLLRHLKQIIIAMNPSVRNGLRFQKGICVLVDDECSDCDELRFNWPSYLAMNQKTFVDQVRGLRAVASGKLPGETLPNERLQSIKMPEWK